MTQKAEVKKRWGESDNAIFKKKMCKDDLKQPNLDLDTSLNFKQF